MRSCYINLNGVSYNQLTPFVFLLSYWYPWLLIAFTGSKKTLITTKVQCPPACRSRLIPAARAANDELRRITVPMSIHDAFRLV